MAIRSIGIVGAGTMGSGIAQAFAVSGYPVVITDIGAAQLERAVKTIDGGLERLVKREKLSADDKAAVIGRIRTTTNLADLAGVDLLIEAATENLALKLEIFKGIDAALNADAIIASNTSSISISRLAAATGRPDKVIGMHFFNPVPVMQLIEVIRGLATSDATYAEVDAISRKIGKAPVKIKNSPGFVVNRLLCPMINEAVFALQEGLAAAREIDDSMKLGCNHPIGPLALCDLIGLDVELAVMNVLYDGFKDSKYRPAPLLVEMVEAGYLGRKTGRGFYTY
ncbi:MAG: 3-hydroxybutyryl-CoA dehydrogenase [Burkholderiales bacterium]